MKVIDTHTHLPGYAFGLTPRPMADLRRVLEGLGFRDVRTYLQSGNAVFEAQGSPDEHAAAIASLVALIAVVAPLGWGHTYVMVLPLVMLRLAEIRNAAAFKTAAVVACVLALSLPAGRHFPLDQLPGWLQNIFYSRYLIATVAMVGLTSASNRRM